jgi:hypothetical protein
VSYDICPACGYPAMGPNLCAACQQLISENQTNALWQSGAFAGVDPGITGPPMRPAVNG